MKILQIANYKPGTGGISGQVEKIHACLDEDGIDNAIFSVKGSAVYRINAFFRLFKEGRKYDVFHIHTCSGGGFISAVMGIIVGRCLKKRIVLTYHGGDGRRFLRDILVSSDGSCVGLMRILPCLVLLVAFSRILTFRMLRFPISSSWMLPVLRRGR
ncbi:MAG: hypothetical protein MJZ85_00900 [Bacteroidales bacterium]|nr:hypothetical protein [Bacteroidales bacterium]